MQFTINHVNYLTISYEWLQFSDLCNKNFLCSHWQSSHHTFEDEEYTGTRVFSCLLLTSCNPQSTSSSYPIVTNSGNRFCLPNPFKRRPCQPACPRSRKFCHGRCVHGGMRCFFAPCSKSPYKEDAGSSCSQLAMETEENECRGQCADISSGNGISSCQSCLVANLPQSCGEQSGATCWYCSGLVLEKWKQCSSHQDPVSTINCIKQGLGSGCTECVCTLVCYWEADGDICRSCIEQPQLSTLFNNHQYCPKGWVYSSSSSKCFKVFTDSKPWKFASRFCQNGGGILAQPKTDSIINAVLEAISLQGSIGKYWIGGKETGQFNGQSFIWTGDNTIVPLDASQGNWAIGFPMSG